MSAPLAGWSRASYITYGARKSGTADGTASENGKDAWNAALGARIQA
jgi:hypothetical protein